MIRIFPLILFLVVVNTASAAPIAVFGANAASAANLINLNGGSATVITSVTAGTLSGFDGLWALNSSNSGQGLLSGVSGVISAYVSGGGAFFYHDRRVTGAEAILPGGGGTTFVRETAGGAPGSADIDVVPGSSPWTDGLNNTVLDGFSLSNHGYATLGTLPVGATPLLTNGNPGEIVEYFYSFGAGTVYYSTIPFDFYVSGSTAMATVYGPQFAANAIAISNQTAAVPEPGSAILLGCAFASLVVSRRRRRTKAPALVTA